MIQNRKRWLFATLWLLLIGLLFLSGCDESDRSPTNTSQTSVSSVYTDTLSLKDTALMPDESATTYEAQYTPVEDGTILAVSQDAILMCEQDQRWLEWRDEWTKVQSETVGVLSYDDSIYLALGSDPVSILLPDGQGLELPNQAGFLSGSGTAYVHFAIEDKLLYVLNGTYLYSYDGQALTSMEDSVQWRGIGAVDGNVYAVGAIRTGDVEDSALLDYLFLLDNTACVCLGRLELEGAVQKLCGGKALYLMTDRALYAWTEASFTYLGSLVDLGLSGDSIVDMTEAEDGLLLAEAQGIFTLLPGSNDGGSSTLTAAYIPDSWGSFPTAMAAFNRTHTDIQVKAVAYETEAELSLSLTVGEVPDIICVGDNPAYLQTLASKDVLQPLDDNLDNLSRQGNYFENIFSACAIEGNTYFFCPTYYLYGMQVPLSLTGGAAQLNTLDDLEHAFQSLGEDSYRWMLKEDMLYNLICDGYTAFIDEQNATAFFETEAFYAVLEFCNRFAATQQDLVLDNANQPFSFVRLYDPSELMRFSVKMEEKTEYGSRVGYYPLPLSSFNGLGIGGSYFVGLCAASQQQEAAWEVLRYLLSDEVQEKASDTFCLPVSRSVCERIWNQVLNQDNPDGYNEYYRGFRAQFETLLEGADHLNVAAAPAIRDIILEEAAAYFAGDKSAEAVSANIQNRALLYLAEQS